MAEFLVKAVGHWMDDFSQERIDSMEEKQLFDFNARSQIGDIVCVYKDDTCKEPSSSDSAYIILKVKGYEFEKAKLFEQALNTEIEKPYLTEVPKADWEDPEKQKNILTLDNVIKSSISATLSQKEGQKEGIYSISGVKLQNRMMKHRKFNVNKGEIALVLKNKKDLEIDKKTFDSCLIEKVE